MRPATIFVLLTAVCTQSSIVVAKNFSTLPWGRQQSVLPRRLTPFDTRPADCPPCFNCNLEDFQCQNFGECAAASGRCTCPEGFGGEDCSVPLCGSPAQGLDRAPRPQDQKQCQCAEGWEGINCNVCSTNDACNAFMPEGKDGVCYRNGLVQKRNSQACDVTNKQIVDMLDPRKPQVTFSCEAGIKTCGFQFWVAEQESFYCSLDSCEGDSQAFGDRNVTRYSCATVQCRCVPGRFLCGDGPDLTGILQEQITGPGVFTSITYADNPSKDQTTFSEPHLDGLISGVFGDESITLKCSGGECLYKTQVPGFTKPVKKVNTSAVAGLIAGSALLVVAIGIGFAWLSRRRATSSPYNVVHVDDEDDASAPLMTDHKPAALHFENVCYRVANKQILTDVQGSVQPGEILAIMGASGAGKTSFLDILAHKNKGGSPSGAIYVNGEKLSDTAFRNTVGFVDQEDTMLPTLTVHETILDSAMLRLPKDMSWSAKLQRVEDVERQLGIWHVRDSIIGSPTRRGISGGEKRRVSIACELVTSPSILFLDEPTSGLDAANAYNVVKCLANLAKRYQRTVVLTIHQPRSNIVTLFDRLIVLAEGHPAYSGPLSECRQYLDSIGCPCPSGYNITDYLVDLTIRAADSDAETDSPPFVGRRSTDSVDSVDGLTDEKKGAGWTEKSKPTGSDSSTGSSRMSTSQVAVTHSATGDLDAIIAGYRHSQHAAQLQADIQAVVKANGNASLASSTAYTGYTKIGIFGQFRILSVRTWRNLYRNPMLLMTHYVISVLLGVLLGYLFFGLTDDIAGFQNRMGVLTFVLALFGFASLTSLTIFADERLLFMRERAKGYYHPFAYFGAKVVFDIVPLRLIPPIILSAIVYPMAGLVPTWSHFGVFVSILALFNIAAATACLLIGIVVRNGGTANLLGSLTMLFSLLLSGLFLNYDKIPAGARWLHMLSIFHYALEGLLVNEVRYLSLVERKYGLDIEVPGASILSSFGFDIKALGTDVAGLSSLTFVFLVFAYLAMHFLLLEKR